MAEKNKKTAEQKSVALFDKRIMTRNVAKGAVGKAEVDAHMKDLPDLAAQADNIADKVWSTER